MGKHAEGVAPRYLKFGRRIRKFRHALDMNQIELSCALGVHRLTVVRWEAGQTCPSVDQLPDLADVLGIDVSWLFRDDLVYRESE